MLACTKSSAVLPEGTVGYVGRPRVVVLLQPCGLHNCSNLAEKEKQTKKKRRRKSLLKGSSIHKSSTSPCGNFNKTVHLCQGFAADWLQSCGAKLSIDGYSFGKSLQTVVLD